MRKTKPKLSKKFKSDGYQKKTKLFLNFYNKNLLKKLNNLLKKN